MCLLGKADGAKRWFVLEKKNLNFRDGSFLFINNQVCFTLWFGFFFKEEKRNLYKNSKKDLFFPVPVFLIYIPISSGLSSLSFLFLPMEYSVQRSQSDRKKEQWALPAAYPIKNEKFKMIIRQ